MLLSKQVKIHTYHHFYHEKRLWLVFVLFPIAHLGTTEKATVLKHTLERRKGSALERANCLEKGRMSSIEPSFPGRVFPLYLLFFFF